MYFSDITIPRLTNETLAQLEAVAPGITAFPGIQLVHSSDDAVELATQQLKDVLAYNESVGGVESLTETATGWDIKLQVLTSRLERQKF
jgi:hypothetical protein